MSPAASTTPPPDLTDSDPLAVRHAEAARMLGLSPRKLDELVAGGVLPVARIGRARTYPVAGLRAYLAAITEPARSGPLAPHATGGRP